MKRLIKNGDVILDGTLTYNQKVKQACEELEQFEDLLAKYHINSIKELEEVLEGYYSGNMLY